VSGAAGTDISCWVKNPYAGQFDALGDWSMANAYAVPGEPTSPSQCPLSECPDGNPVGDWAVLHYVGHANDHFGSGSSRDTTVEVLSDLALDAGDYTIVAGDGCPACTPGGFVGGKISLTVSTSDLLPGKKLLLKTKAGSPAKSTLALAAKDATITLGSGNGSIDDPTSVGATVRVHSGAGGFDDTYTLPPANWALIGKPGQNKGYKYKDKTLTAGPISVAVIKNAKGMTVVGKGAGLGHSLAANPAPVDVTVTIGSHRYCFQFGGAQKWKVGAQLKAVDAGAPAACAP